MVNATGQEIYDFGGFALDVVSDDSPRAIASSCSSRKRTISSWRSCGEAAGW